ncbi:unnamed protein product, partial [Mesorhabditis spiculigera]
MKDDTFTMVASALLGSLQMSIFFGVNILAFLVESITHSVRVRCPECIIDFAGYYGQCILYITYTLANLVAPVVLEKTSAKTTLVMGAGAFAIYGVTFLHVRTWLYFMACGLAGIGYALYYVGAGAYSAKHSTVETFSRNTAIVWMLAGSSMIPNSLFMMASSEFSKDERPPEQYSSLNITEIKSEYRYYSEFEIRMLILGIMAVASWSIVLAFLLPSRKIEDSIYAKRKAGPRTVAEQLSTIGWALGQTGMLKMIPLHVFTGFFTAFWLSVYTTTIAFTTAFAPYPNLIAYSTIGLAVGEICFGVFVNVASRKIRDFGLWPAFAVSCITFSITAVLLVLFVPPESPIHPTSGSAYFTPNFYVAILIGWLCGVVDGSINNCRMVASARALPTHPAVAFSIAKFYQAIGAAFFYYASSLFTMAQLTSLLSITLLLGIFAFNSLMKDFERSSVELFFSATTISSTDFCASGYCYYGGTCVEGYGTFLCQCTDDFWGRQCENARLCYTDPPNCHNGNCWAMVWTDSSGAVSYINTSCSCYAGWEGDFCDQQLDACADDPCDGNATCMSFGYNFSCVCPEGMGGSDCSLELDVDDPENDYCSPDPCVAGFCVNATATENWACKCVPDATYPAMSNQNCSQPDYGYYCDPTLCVYGSCGISTTYNETTKEITNVTTQCYCYAGFVGKVCNQEYDICANEAPCQNGGSCDYTWGSWLCTCAPGWTGSNCTDIYTPTTTETTIEAETSTANTAAAGARTTTTEMATVDPGYVGTPCVCTNVSYGGKVYHGDVCQVLDSGGVCVDNPDGSGFTCQCTSNFTGQYCDMAANLGVMLAQLYGNLTPEEMQEIREDLQSHPPKLQDLIPFITGPMAEDVRAALSWAYSDFFLDTAFERKGIDFDSEFIQTNDVLRVQEAEYPYWVDTAGITVFVHKIGEAVFSESSRTEAVAGAFSKLFIGQTDYSRLGGHYGSCAKSVSDVKSYYYEGIYTIDGCYRSCYQDLLFALCNCMDPRYPFPASKPSCDIPQRSCLNDFTAKYGDDPASLPGCNCPQPCEYSQFDTAWSIAPYPAVLYECQLSSNVSACQAAYLDSVKIEVNFQSLTRLIYQEEPEMSLNAFLGYLGGILGILCGISIVTFIEFGYIALIIISILTKGKK